MIRLRQVVEAGLRHPLWGPLLLVFLAVILAFVALHTIEDGAEGLLLTCAIVAAAGLRLLAVVPGRTWLATAHDLPLFGRAPPTRARRLLPRSRLSPVLLALPLRL